MSYKTYFKCYECKKVFIGKQNLTLAGDHLYCGKCIDDMPEQKYFLWLVEYKTKRGLVKCTRLFNLPTEDEARQWLFKHGAHEIIVLKSVENTSQEAINWR